MLHDIEFDPAALSSLCERFHVRTLWLFGSIVRSDFRPDSDVDVLIDLAEPVGLFKLGEFRSMLSDLLARDVHLTTLHSVPSEIRSGVLSSAMVQYAAA